MADPKSYSEIVEIAISLHNQFQPLRSDAESRYKLYTLRKTPEIAEDVAREGIVPMLSPMVIHSAHTIRSDLMMNPTEFIVVPLAREPGRAVIDRDKRKADNLERSLAIIWSALNEGRRIDREIIWHQLCSPFGVMVLECNDLVFPDQGDLSDEDYVDLLQRHRLTMMPWSISTPDPMTCSFHEYKGMPTLFVRKYKQVVREVKRTYSRRQGTDNWDADLVLKDGAWDWVKMSDEYSTEIMTGSRPYRQTVDDLEEVEMVWMDDGQYIYQVAMNPISRRSSKASGRLVWYGPNPIGRVSAFVIGSNITPLRNPEDRWEPYLWPLMQTVNQINTIRTHRATSARNESGPDNYVAMDPQTIAAYISAGKDLPQRLTHRKGETPYIPGQILPTPGATSVDYDKLEMQLNQEIQRYLPSPFVNVLDPAVLKAATASAILHAAEAGIRMYGPLMSAYDAQIKGVMEGIIYSALYHYKDESFFAVATGEEIAKGKPIAAGSAFVLNKEALSFPYKLNVKTRSMTQAQASAQYELALKQRLLPDGTPGPMTLDDLIDAANIPDKEAQKEKIAEEQILKAIDPYIQQMALAAAIVEIEYQTGLKLPVGAESPPPQSTPSRLPNSAQRMDSPYVMPHEGGSEPTLNV